MSWKKLLDQYVQYKNIWESECRYDDDSLTILDKQSRNRQIKKLTQMKDLFRERRLTPINSQIRLKLIHVRETDNRVDVDIKLHRLFRYNIQQVEHREERIEYETLKLLEDNQGWHIQSIAPDLSEALSFPNGKQEAFSSLQNDRSRLEELGIVFPSMPIFHKGVYSNPTFSSRAIRYERYKAQQYADRWWHHPNPQYITFEVDCTNFISQCLYAGNAPMDYTGKRSSGWWYHGKKNGQELWSYSWAVAQSFQSLLKTSKKGLHSTQVEAPWQLTIGDVINYAWDGQQFEHSTIVTAFDAAGMPLVNAHTVSSKHRYWDYRDSPAWTEETRYEFFHIADQF